MAAPFCQGVVENQKVPPEPSFLQAEALKHSSRSSDFASQCTESITHHESGDLLPLEKARGSQNHQAELLGLETAETPAPRGKGSTQDEKSSGCSEPGQA